MKNTLKSVSFFVLLLVLFGFVSCKAESGDDASIPVTTQEKPTNQPQPTPQPQAGTYIVQHYQQDTTGDGYTLFETERLTGTAGEQTKAAAKTYEHFAAKTFSQAEIKADGSTVIRIDYDREIITLIFDKADESANWNDEWSGQAQDGKITIKGRYGANVAAPTIPKKTGYGTSWDKEVQTTFASNETYTAQYTEGQVNYTVEHWLENLENDEYTKQFTEDDKTGTTGSQTAAEPKSEYAEQGYEIPTVTQATISADGSTVVQIRYARKRYTVSFETNGAGTVTSQTVKHGGKVGEPAALTKTGYNFKGWFVSTDGGTTLADTAFDFANTTITDDVALYAKWEIKTISYTVRHFQQNLDNDNYTEYETVTLSGRFGEQTTAVAKTYTGFTAQTFSQKTIGDAEPIVIDIRYNRNIYTVTFDSKGGSIVANQSIKYGKLINNPSTTKENYNFEGWFTSFDNGTTLSATAFDFSSLIEGNVKLYAKWRIITYTVTFDSKGGTDVASQVVVRGEKVNEPTSTKSPYDFLGWFTSTDDGATLSDTPFNFDSGIDSDVALFAKWEIRATADNVASKIAAMTESDEVIVTGEITDATLTEIRKAINAKNFGIGIDLSGTDGLVSIKDIAFNHCRSLTSIELPSGVTSIGKQAFLGCVGLTSISLPIGVTSIGYSAFYMCSGLTNINLPSGVTSIGEWAFRECSGLTSIELPSGVTSIGEYAFSGCSGLTSINVSVDNIEYTSIDGVLYSKDKTRIVAYPSGKSATSYEILESVTSIGEEAFEGCSGLTSIRLPSGLTSIGAVAFYKCSGLTSIRLPSGLTSIGEYAFYKCSGLTSIRLPSGLTSIGEYAFGGCSGLTSIELPSGLTSIGDYAFSDCRGLTSISLPSGLTSIGDYAFYWCSGLTSINLPSGVTSIGDYAFSDCSGLTSIELPSGVTSIGRYAFNYCRSLTSITFAGTVEQWNAITKSNSWRSGVPATKVVCSDGEVSL